MIFSSISLTAFSFSNYTFLTFAQPDHSPFPKHTLYISHAFHSPTTFVTPVSINFWLRHFNLLFNVQSKCSFPLSYMTLPPPTSERSNLLLSVHSAFRYLLNDWVNFLQQRSQCLLLLNWLQYVHWSVTSLDSKLPKVMNHILFESPTEPVRCT